MFKSNIFHQKEEIFQYPPNKVYNLLSPPYNTKLKTKTYINPYINTNLPNIRPINLYSSYFTPFQNDKNLSVKNINSPDEKETQNLLSKFSPNQKGTNSKIIGSPNTTNSDLLTSTSLNSQQSNESLLSNNTNNSIYIPTSFQPYNFSVNRTNNYYSIINPKLNFQYNSININGNKQSIKKYNINNIVNNNNEYINNFNSDNSSKSSSSNSDKTDSNKINIKKKSKGKLYENIQRKKYFNKFNSSKENSTNENTVILTLKIKVAKNDYRIFNLKKYDDLFVSLEKFFDLNQIDQSLVKPIVNKIFAALNKIFWLLNNKIGKYDQKYLKSLYNLWIKNNETLPKRKKSKEENNNSSISSNSESNEDNKHKKLMSNSFQDGNNLSEEEKDEKQKTSKSI